MTTTMQTTMQVYSVFIRATPESIWDAITKPEFTQRYFHGSVIDSTYEPGASYTGWSADRSRQFVEGEVLEVDPPRKLVTTWRAVWDPEMAAEAFSRVTWELEPAGEHVTRLTVVHDELEAAPKTAAGVAAPDGWSFVLSGLKTLVETGEPLGA
jgi:uncharacterized protein YndB with AHSA1/START domain